LHGAFIEEPAAIDQSLYILIAARDDTALLKHCLGILCSRLAAWYLRTKHSIYDTLYPWYTKRQLADFPTKPYDPRMSHLVDRLLGLQNQLSAVKTPHDKESLQRQIDATDRQIDELVYELYALTEEEIQIVEGHP
jgi:hypothetical protein